MANSKPWDIAIRYFNGYLSANPPARSTMGRLMRLVTLLMSAADSGDSPDCPSMDIWWNMHPVIMADGITVM